MTDEFKILLEQSELPQAWYNILPDMPTEPPPALNPATKQPVGPEDLAPLFPMALIMQGATRERYVEIPEPVQEIYRLWRPSPLHRAVRLERTLGTPARIYYKNEGVSPPGSHKPNTAVAQAYYCKAEGVKAMTTETGAGQWGSALAMAASMFDLRCKIYMVKVSYYQKPYRRSLMHVWGAEVTPSPSDETEAGRKMLAAAPDSLGSLGIAISEAIEVALSDKDTKYILGSVLPHVLLHQTVIGEETLKQMALVEDYPDVVIGCVGGGSNYAGLAFPFVREKLDRGLETRFVATEPTACPTLTKGRYTYDFGDTNETTPLLKMHTLGHDFVPPGIHAGGLRYHGMAPQISALVESGLVEAVAYPQNPVFQAAATFARAEGIVPAPETAHAIRAAIDEALDAKAKGEERCILFNLSGHGHFDMAAYDAYFSGELVDYEYPEEEIDKALSALPAID